MINLHEILRKSGWRVLGSLLVGGVILAFFIWAMLCIMGWFQ